jgi:hypothetical protein
MKAIDFPIDRINRFFEGHSFEIENPFGSGMNSMITLTVKVQLTGIKQMISIGEWMDFIEYTIFLENVDNAFAHKVLNSQFEALKTNDYKIANTDTTFYLITANTNSMIRNFLKHFGVDNHVTCTRIVNNLGKDNFNNMNESLIVEGKYDSMTRKLVKDVLSVFKYQKEGEFTLPEDIGGDMTYKFPVLDTHFTIELSLDQSDEVETIDLNAEYFEDDDTIRIYITSNPHLDREVLEELHFELNEIIRHELEHIIQFERGDDIPDEEPEESLVYYTQPHELGAQIAGFKRKAQKLRKPLETVIRDWFDKNPSKHRMKPKEVEIVINRILELA